MRRKKSINRNNILQHLVEYELQLAGRTYLEAVESANWQFEYTISLEQLQQFRGYAIPLLKKVFKFNKKKAEDTFQWFFKMWGLRIKNE